MTSSFIFSSVLCVQCLALIAAHRMVSDQLSYSALPLCEKPNKKIPNDLALVSLESLSEEAIQNRSETIKAMRGKIDRPFTPEEIDTAREQSGFGRMVCNQDKPIAVFILGPPSAGKSSANMEKLKSIGMPLDDWGNPLAATLDGDVWRDNHADYQNLVQWGLDHNPPCMFMDAADILKDYTKPAKSSIFNDAVENKCHVIIPETCSSVDRCVKMALKLRKTGYTVHVIGVIAPKKRIFARGRGRQDRTGRWYNTATFDKCVTAVVPMMALGNGHCELIDNSADWPPAGIGPVTLFPSTCPNMPMFDEKTLLAIKAGESLEGLIAVRFAIMAISGTTKDEFEKDEGRQLGLIAKKFGGKK